MADPKFYSFRTSTPLASVDRNLFVSASLLLVPIGGQISGSAEQRRWTATTAAWGGSGWYRGDKGCCSGGPFYALLLAPELLASQLLLFIALPAMASQGKMQAVPWILSTSSRFYAIVRLVCESPLPTPGFGWAVATAALLSSAISL